MAVATLSRIDERLRETAEDALRGPAFRGASTDAALARLRELATELWLDTGNLEEAKALWHPEFTALTTNNTLVNQVVQTGILDDVVKDTIRELIHSDPEISEEAIIMELGFVVNCHAAIRLVKELDAMVSVELHPDVAADIDRSVYYAERYFAICPERFYIKIPLTPEGYCSVARVRAKGIPVNYTLGFSARQNYLAGLISNPTFVNVFLGRLNAVVADNHLGDGKYVGEKTAIASQAAIRELRGSGKSATRQIAASMRSASQVADLAGMDVFTMPVKVVKEFLASSPDPGQLKSQVDREYPVSFYPGVDPASFDALWSVDDKFRAFADDVKRRDVTTLTGDDLREADADHGTHLFHRFTSVDVVDIRDKGKIPDLDRWKDVPGVSLDNLMTESALQSFAVDQAALDDHLRSLTRSR